MGVEKDELTIQEALAREAQILSESTGTSSGSTGSSSSRSYSSSYGSGRRRRSDSVRINVSGWVADRRHGWRRRTTDRTGS